MADALPPPRISLLVHSPTPSTLVPVLQTLLEPSPPLSTHLAPDLHASFKTKPPGTYSQLLDQAAEIQRGWPIELQAEFLGSHPRIGETVGLSKDSAVEQDPTKATAMGMGQPTPGEVLKRLSMLNALYEEAYPGLRFVTFVNGRARAEVVPEMEAALGLSLEPPSPSTPEPRLHVLREKIKVHPAGSAPWRKELDRGCEAVWSIAKSRLSRWGVE